MGTCKEAQDHGAFSDENRDNSMKEAVSSLTRDFSYSAPVRTTLGRGHNLMGFRHPSEILLAFCLDGNVYALEERTGRILWRTRDAFTDGSLIQRRALRKRRNAKTSNGDNDESRDLLISDGHGGGDELDYVIEPLGDGALFLFDRGQRGKTTAVQKLPQTLRNLVQMSPVRVSGNKRKPGASSTISEADDELFVIAKRESSIFAIDLVTGMVTCRSVRKRRKIFGESEFRKSSRTASSGEEDLEDYNPETSLLIGRSDYRAEAFESITLKPRWDMSFTLFKSLHSERKEETQEEEEEGEEDSRNEDSEGGIDNEWHERRRRLYYPSFHGHLISRGRGGDADLKPWIVQLSSPVLQLFQPRLHRHPNNQGHRLYLHEITLKSTPPVEGYRLHHVQYDAHSSTFYFDDVVNVGELEGGLLFALPQDRYPILRNFPIDRMLPSGDEVPPSGHEDVNANANVIASTVTYLGSERVTRRIAPIAPPQLGYDKYHRGEGNSRALQVVGGIVVTLCCLFLGYWWLVRRRRRYSSLQAKSAAVHEELPATDSAMVPAASLLEVSEEVLGYGSHGTMVFRGRFDGREVAVKRLLGDFFDLADREISMLLQHDTHPNVIRYFYRERQDRFIYIALELAHCTLQEWILWSNVIDRGRREDGELDAEGRAGGLGRGIAVAIELSQSDGFIRSLGRKEFPSNFQVLGETGKISLLRQFMEGLAFLHEMGLVHRDLKPQNILIQFSDAATPRLLISDFGLSRKLVSEESSFQATAASGTVGWRAPEVIFNEETVKFQQSLQSFSDLMVEEGGELGPTASAALASPASLQSSGPLRIGKSVDIFAAGLIFYFVLSSGDHAFGDRLVRESNIVAGRLQIREELLNAEGLELLRRMLKRRPKERPTAREVLSHPFFWSLSRQLAFVCAVSDALEGEERRVKVLREGGAIGASGIENKPGGSGFDARSSGNTPPGYAFGVQNQSQNASAHLLPMRDAIDRRSRAVFPNDAWHRCLDRAVFQDLTRHRYYLVATLHDLLRAIRNKRNHFHETPPAVLDLLGPDLEAAWAYFRLKFPRLLIEVWLAIEPFIRQEAHNSPLLNFYHK